MNQAPWILMSSSFALMAVIACGAPPVEPPAQDASCGPDVGLSRQCVTVPDPTDRSCGGAPQKGYRWVSLTFCLGAECSSTTCEQEPSPE